MAITMEAKRRRRLVLHLSSIVIKLGRDLEIDPRDVKYVLHRLEREGPTFLTKILPLYSAYTLSCIANGGLLPKSELSHFNWKNKSPAFLAGFFKGAILGDPKSLFAIRQFCDYFYKFAFSFTKDELCNAVTEYKNTELVVQTHAESLVTNRSYNAEAEKLRAICETLFPELTTIGPCALLERGTRDGPGAFSGSSDIPRRYNVTFEEYKKLPSHTIGSHSAGFNGCSGFFKAYPSSGLRRRSTPDGELIFFGERLRSVSSDKVCELRFVPKDSRGPRVISKENYHDLKAQMAFNDYLCSYLTRATAGRINFSDQTVNQELSRIASIDGINATIDLKNASDRVSSQLVSVITRNLPGLRYIIANSRATHCRLPNGELIKLAKFANMGSGLCFPILSLVVYLVAIHAISRYHPRCSYKDIGKMVYVYGDDLIVPARYFAAVNSSMNIFGLMINQRKSFYTGFFRESCGADFYHGVDVTPVRLKLTAGHFNPISDYRNGCVPITEDACFTQLCEHAKELEKNGLSILADYYYSQLEKVFGTLPYVSYECAAMGKYKANQIVPYASVEAYLPKPQLRFNENVCCFKGMRTFLATGISHGRDFCLTALRHKLKLKRGLLDGASRTGSGLPGSNIAL